jgi:hypothetical protein
MQARNATGALALAAVLLAGRANTGDVDPEVARRAADRGRLEQLLWRTYAG